MIVAEAPKIIIKMPTKKPGVWRQYTILLESERWIEDPIVLDDDFGPVELATWIFAGGSTDVEVHRKVHIDFAGTIIRDENVED